MTSARIAVMYGLGGAGVEWWPNGERLLVQRLKTKGVDTGDSPWNWDDRQQVYNFLNGFTGFRGLIGDSLGAGSAAQYGADQKGQIDYAGGFQPSIYDSRVVIQPDGTKVIPVAANVIRAHCVYDPDVADTGGLGAAQYAKTSGAKTVVFVTQHRGAHPDDWGYSQDLLFNEVTALIAAQRVQP